MGTPLSLDCCIPISGSCQNTQRLHLIGTKVNYSQPLISSHLDKKTFHAVVAGCDVIISWLVIVEYKCHGFVYSTCIEIMQVLKADKDLPQGLGVGVTRATYHPSLVVHIELSVLIHVCPAANLLHSPVSGTAARDSSLSSPASLIHHLILCLHEPKRTCQDGQGMRSAPD